MPSIHRPLLKFVITVVAHPLRTLVIAGVLLLACMAAALWKLNISTDQNRLFNPRVPFFRDYLAFVERFPENEAIYIVIQPKDPTAQPPVARWTQLADSISQRLRSLTQYVKLVDHRVVPQEMGEQGLLFDDPALVRKSFQEVKRFAPLVKLWAEKPSLLERALGETPLERLVTALRMQQPNDETRAFVDLLARSWNRTLESAEPVLPDLATLDAADPSRLGYYYVSDQSDPSRSLLLVRVYHQVNYTSLTAISETVEAIRAAAKQAAADFPEFDVGVTGRPALEADEMRTTDRDTHRAEILALSAVFIGLVIMLRSVWLALVGEIALGVGIGWTFGWATISVGELNLLSIVFLLALIGIGMDYLVQILTRYRQEFRRRARAKTIWTAVFRQVAPPINTACMGAAGAFFVSLLTDFRGAAQLGLIAGGGLILCLVAGYVIIPPLLTLFPPRIRRADHFRTHLGPPAGGGRRSFVAPALWGALLLAGVPLMFRAGFDPNLLKLQAQNLESVQLVRKLDTWSAVVLSKDLDVLRRARDAITGAPTVASTESILLAHDNLAWLREHADELPAIVWAEPAPVDADDLRRIAEKARSLAQHFDDLGSLTEFADALAGDDGSSVEKLTVWQSAFVPRLRETLAQFNPGGIDLNRLPPALKHHLVGTDGSFALYIYPNGDLWQQQELAQFVDDVQSRLASVTGDFTLTGIAINIHHSTDSIERSFYRSTLFAMLLIFILVLIDLRNVGHTLLAVSVLGLGLPMLVAGMGFTKAFLRIPDVDWNFANFFGLPILIGAGHEYGVFLVHRYREALHDPRRVWRRWDVADKAMVLCAYITCVAFGFFALLAHHRGLRSLGIVMTLGTVCIYLSGILVLRPLLIWRLTSRRGPAPQQARRPLRRKVRHEKRSA